MAHYNNSEIPEHKFAHVTIGNNGVRIIQDDKTTIYLSAEDIVEIFHKFIGEFPVAQLDEIETVYLGNGEEVEEDLDSDEILDAIY